MAIEVNWSDEAKETFEKNINYLQNEWSEKDVIKFIQQTEIIVEWLKKFPLSFPPGLKNKKYRRARLNKYIALFYRFYKTKDQVILITFWNIKQNPGKLKY
ncbi:MAG: type II toxin-antitoxin system RelE/ParE family toxin [Bacteroidetes bacterium]|nr:type II toxin-antitoxin system RelE/ParE family toxin [Bacteroidota bacterium]